MHKASDTGKGTLKIATIMYIILPFGIWASKCVPSTLCAMFLFLTGPCGERAFSDLARLQWPSNLASFSKKEHMRSWNPDGELTCLVFSNLTYRVPIVYRWGDRPLQNPEFTQVLMENQGDKSCPWLQDPAASYHTALPLQRPCANFHFLPLSPTLPWQTQGSPSTGTTEVTWVGVLSGGWQALLGTMTNQRAQSCLTCKAQVLTAGAWAQYGDSLQFFKKSQKSRFLFEISQAGRIQKTCMQVDFCQLPARLLPPLKCMLLTS